MIDDFTLAFLVSSCCGFDTNGSRLKVSVYRVGLVDGLGGKGTTYKYI